MQRGYICQLERKSEVIVLSSYSLLNGSDIASGPVWMEYIAFLKSKPAASPQEESQHMTSMCKVYQKAILKPMHHLNQLWRDYEMFENFVSRTPVPFITIMQVERVNENEDLLHLSN